MISKLLSLALELCMLALMTSAIAIKRYQDYPLQVCPIKAVCSEIYSVQSRGLTPSYLNYVMCKCPTGLYCPTAPGPQTLNSESDTWYGMCQPVEDLPACQQGDVAEEVYVKAQQFGGKTYTKVHCTCSGHLTRSPLEGKSTIWADTTSDSSEAKTIFHLVCADDLQPQKRGRYGDGRYGGGNSRSRGRFYFYRK